MASATQWGKLIWKDAETMLFVSINGVKMFEMQMVELTKKLRHGQAAIVIFDQRTITKRVLSELMDL